MILSVDSWLDVMYRYVEEDMDFQMLPLASALVPSMNLTGQDESSKTPILQSRAARVCIRPRELKMDEQR